MIKYLLTFCACISILEIHAQIITTIAGTGVAGYSGDNGPATLAKFNAPGCIQIDTNGIIYISDVFNTCIRKIDTIGIVVTICGDTIMGCSGDNGPATAAKMKYPAYLYLNKNGDLYIPDDACSNIRKISSSGIIKNFAGNGCSLISADGTIATNACIGGPFGVVMDKIGNLYFTDGICGIRKIDTFGILHTVAGTTVGYFGDGGQATAAQISETVNLIFDKYNNIIFTDMNNYRIRKIDTNGIITTIAGTGFYGYNGDNILATNAMVSTLEGLTTDDIGNVYFGDADNQRVRKIDTNGIVTTIAGTGVFGYNGDNILATDAQLYGPEGLAFDKHGNLYIADYYNNRIRKVTNVGVMLGAENVVQKAEAVVQVYPNPATNVLNVVGAAGCEVGVYDMVGRRVFVGFSVGDKYVIDVSRLVGGVYFVEAVDGSTGERVVKRFCLQ